VRTTMENTTLIDSPGLRTGEETTVALPKLNFRRFSDGF
jgi:hypothetical protein